MQFVLCFNFRNYFYVPFLRGSSWQPRILSIGYLFYIFLSLPHSQFFVFVAFFLCNTLLSECQIARQSHTTERVVGQCKHNLINSERREGKVHKGETVASLVKVEVT